MISPFPYTLVDLSHPLSTTMPTWSGNQGFKIEVIHDYHQSATKTKFRVQQLSLDAGASTHMDAPAHCLADAATVADIPLEHLFSPCAVISVAERADEKYQIKVADIVAFETEHGPLTVGMFVILHTGWDRWWRDPARYQNEKRFPGLSLEAAEFLLSRQVRGVGIDTFSIEAPQNDFPVHQLLLGAGLYLIENIANADQMPPAGAWVAALPLRGIGLTESPVRLVGMIPITR